MADNVLKDVNRNLCQDFCDLAGRDDAYSQAWFFAILLDIVIPIASLILGLTFAFTSALFILLTMGLGILAVIPAAIMLSLMTIFIILAIIFLLIRQIGIFVGIPIVMEFGISLLAQIPEIGFIFSALQLVPWYLIAVFVHLVVYRGFGKDGLKLD